MFNKDTRFCLILIASASFMSLYMPIGCDGIYFFKKIKVYIIYITGLAIEAQFCCDTKIPGVCLVSFLFHLV